jgi:hypothetical protein
MVVDGPVVLNEQAELGRVGLEFRIAAAEANQLRDVEVQWRRVGGPKFELELRIVVGTAAADTEILERQLSAQLN